MEHNTASEPSATATARVRAALAASRDLAPDYLARLAASRAGADPRAAGSVYDGRTDAEVLALWHGAAWAPYAHPAVMLGCVAFRALIPGGRIGLAEIDALPRDAALVLSDPKGTGYVEAHVAGVRGEPCETTVAILGDDDDSAVPAGRREVVYTIHPGDPIAPSRVAAVAPYGHGTRVGPDAAFALGLRLAKIVAAP